MMNVPALDHLILLVNDGCTASGESRGFLHLHRHRTHDEGKTALSVAVSLYTQLGFKVIEGGVHSDGLTSNALIVFPDGVYIELIQFEAHPPSNTQESQESFEERRKRHWWYHCKPGWIDWCLSDGLTSGAVQSINATASALRLQSIQSMLQNPTIADSVVAPRLLYDEPLAGGRRKADGTEIQWKVSFPHPPSKQCIQGVDVDVGNTRSHVPFWCHDVTPRDRRVPSTEALHQNRSPGIAEITLLYAKDTLRAYLDISLCLDRSQQSLTLPISAEGQLIPNEIPFRILQTPVDVEGRPRHPPIKVTVKVAEDPADLKWVEEHGEGLYEVEVFVAADKLPSSAPPDGIERTTLEAGLGRLRLSPVLQ